MKPHYPILDGLRGVAALMVVCFHLFESHAASRFEQVINHGYLAVDFFFLLSGFVIGYAYDERWGKMGIKHFFKLRLVRLQPMVIIGMLIGAVFFYFQDSVLWPDLHTVPVWKMLLILFIGFFMLPVPTSMDIRGWQEMYPLNGPAWSLFFEYIANILYAVIVRRFSKTALGILVGIAAAALIHFAVTNSTGDLIGGWSLEPEQLRTGFTRLIFPFFAGLMLYRIAKLSTFKNAFLWCSLLLILMLSLPRIGGTEHLWMNGLYDAMSVILVFPIIVFMGASGTIEGIFANRLCKFLGDISYPIYIIHYPLIYTYAGWVQTKKVSLEKAFPVFLLVLFSAILIAFACLKLYDEPVRAWLKKKFL